MEQLNKFKSLIKKYDRKPLTGAEISRLLELEYIVKQRNGTFTVGDGFASLFIDKYKAADEFWNAYPSFITINKKRVPLKSIDFRIFRDKYFTAINGNVIEHTKILSILEYAKDQDFTFTKIETFISSKQWKEIQKERDKNLDEGTITTFTNSIDNDF